MSLLKAAGIPLSDLMSLHATIFGLLCTVDYLSTCLFISLCWVAYRWRVGGCSENRAPELAADMLGHADWVNDLALRPELLASCSSDRTVRLWRPEGAHADSSLYDSKYPLTLVCGVC